MSKLPNKFTITKKVKTVGLRNIYGHRLNELWIYTYKTVKENEARKEKCIIWVQFHITCILAKRIVVKHIDQEKIGAQNVA